MELLESLDNFIKRTLSVVPGLWHKLAYLGGLKKADAYEHWGLSKRYGNQATQSALQAAHEDVFLQVLRKPVKNLLAEVKENAAEKELPATEYVEELWLSRTPMVPKEPNGGSERHFEVTLQALRNLVKAAGPDRPDEPPRRPPGQ